MTLEKAIEILKKHKELNLVDKNPNLKKAIKLLIEAGKRVLDQRSPDGWLGDAMLPGETKT